MKKLLALLAAVISFLTGCAKESLNVGVIGGADGPTAVMVSQNAPMLPMALVILGVAVVVAIIIAFIHKR